MFSSNVFPFNGKEREKKINIRETHSSNLIEINLAGNISEILYFNPNVYVYYCFILLLLLLLLNLYLYK